MIVLALDSTTPSGSVGLGLPDGTCHVRRSEATRGWSERLPGELLALLEAHAVRPAEVDLFAVASGPGSLTGLRVGIATMQGLAFATGRPVVGISALDALAEHGCHARVPAQGAGPPLVGAWTNAMRGEVFSALYERRPAHEPEAEPCALLSGPAVGPPCEAAVQLAHLAGSRGLVAVGDVEGPLGDALREVLGPRVWCVERPVLAPLLLQIARRLGARGAVGPPHAIQPVYVRRPDAELARERGRVAGRQPGPAAP